MIEVETGPFPNRHDERFLATAPGVCAFDAVVHFVFGAFGGSGDSGAAVHQATKDTKIHQV